MDKINLIPKIKQIFDDGQNIMQYLKEIDGRSENSVENILISYDFQSGSYIKYVKENPNYINAYTTAIANIISDLGSFSSLLEAGVGEATTLGNLKYKLKNKVNLFGFDISWSRIYYGLNYLSELNVPAKLFVADLFKIPLKDSSIDIVYTSHAIEPNGGREKEAIIELYRITNKYLILLEPTYEFADEIGKKRMKQLAYIHNLKDIISNLKYELIEYRPFEISANPLNPTGLYIIRKQNHLNENNDFEFYCPIGKHKLLEYNDHFFSSYSLISYPKIMGIPCLCESYGILTTKHE